MPRRFPSLFLISVLLLLYAGALFAQAGGASLRGVVVDESGGALPGVTVTATNNATGFSRSVVTGSDGSYFFPSLPVGTYKVVAELSGFAPTTIQDVVLNVASERELRITMKAATVTEQITVTAEASLIETSPSVGTVVSQSELENLPLNGRQFANLASLAPGTTLSSNSDPTKPGQLVVALNGGTGRNVNYVIDGGDNTDDTIGGALQNFNLEAVQEFKIQTMQYKAEYGRSSGGVLTVVTKTGTNDLGGSVYGFFRDKGLNEKTKSEELNHVDKSDYERKQYGASLGGPIVRDRAHFFATYEKLNRDTNYVVSSDGIFPQLDGQIVGTPFRDELLTAKGTVNLTPSQYLQVRYGYQKNTDTYGASSLPDPSSLGTTTNKYRSVLAGHSWTLGGSKLNEFVYQWTKFNNGITANSDAPAILFPNGFSTGQNVNTPQTTNQEKSQFKNDFSWSSNLFGGRHDFKTGLAYIHEPTLGGDFSTGLAGQYTMLRNEASSPVIEIVINGGFFGDSTPVDQYSAYLQDDWSVNTRFTINAGLRYDYWEGFDLEQSSNPIWQALHTQRKYSEDIYKQFWDADSRLENDDNNISPRLGFSWDLHGDTKRVLRGGIGRFYDFPYTNATILFPAAAVQSNYGTVYAYSDPTGIKNANGSFFRPGVDPLPANQLPGADIPPPNEVAAPNITNVPFSDQVSLGYSWEVNEWLGLNFEAVNVWYKDIPFRMRGNPALDEQGRPYKNANGSARRRFADFGVGHNWRLWSGGGKAEYTGFNIGAKARMSNKLELQGFYTWSDVEGNVLTGADEFRLTGSDFQPDMHRLGRDASINTLDPWCSACFGPLYSDAKHRVTLSAVYQAPFDINISGVLRYRSGYPYTKLAGSDLNGDAFSNDLAPGTSHVNTERGDSFNQIDVRVGKEFRFGGGYGVELIGEIFNLLDSDNPDNFSSNGQPSNYAGDPGQGEQRLAQLGVRFRF